MVETIETLASLPIGNIFSEHQINGILTSCYILIFFKKDYEFFNVNITRSLNSDKLRTEDRKIEVNIIVWNMGSISSM